MARRGKNRAGFFSCVRADYIERIFLPVIYAYIYNRGGAGQAQESRGGSNWLWAYLAYGGRKLGSNRHRWHDMVMMQSALITCLLYII